MLVKIEISGLIVGVLSCLWMWFLIINYQNLPPTLFEFFKGGNSGGVIIGASLVFGFASIILFATNLIIGNRYKWPIRVTLVFIFILNLAFLGSFI
ncbi:hypothetical protein [Agarivorans sp. QJM3NY_33]|uniref:hypothetical protein n=1 Tax=Agarivorans sp. QJM3NY_33 TaxID=3421432 RepID=UPI003D7C9A3A